MADIKKFLDQSGVSTLWNQVVAEINAKVAAVPEYDDTTVKADIAANTKAITDEVSRAKAAEKANADAIAILNGASSVEGSVAFQIAQIVAGADGDFDTLKEIADWIADHPDSVATLNSAITSEANRAKAAEKVNADAIDALEALVGSKAVATQISEAIAAQDLSKYALASALTETANALTTLKGTGSRLITADEITKLSKLVLGSDGSVSMSGSVAAGNVQGLTAAIDDEIDARIVALTETEIKNACK